MNFSEYAKKIFNLEINALQTLQKNLDESFDQACALLLNKNYRNIIITGIGKSGIIARKFAATLSSTGTPSQFIHAAEALHGDSGSITKKDCIIAISNSGETYEIIQLIPIIKKLKIPLIGITNKKNSRLSKYANITLELHVNKEACPLNLAPTSSTTNTLVLGDAIALSLSNKKKFTKKNFLFSHPNGSLGKILRIDTIKDKIL